MKLTTDNPELRDVYADILAELESNRLTLEQHPELQAAVVGLQHLLERTVLARSADASCSRMFEIKMRLLEQKQPELFDQVEPMFAEFFKLHKVVGDAYVEEKEFCTWLSKVRSSEMLKALGVDPSNAHELLQFLKRAKLAYVDEPSAQFN